MSTRTPLNLSKTELAELERVARRPSTPQALAKRCRVILLDEEDLTVSACFAGQGPTQKRVRPAPMGRAYQVLKRTTHITVQVSERES